jgi:hypothetical protein
VQICYRIFLLRSSESLHIKGHFQITGGCQARVFLERISDPAGSALVAILVLCRLKSKRSVLQWRKAFSPIQITDRELDLT